MSNEDWMIAAMDDDSLVAELLIRLKQIPPPSKGLAPALYVDWIVRQRRSKAVPRHVDVENKNETMRASPTTPLSWSGVTSASGGGTEGFEEFSRFGKTFSGARSEKTVENNEAARKKTKKTKRKKTLAELKDDELLLVEEKRNLKSALMSLRLKVEKQRASNERLKRLKKVHVPPFPLFQSQQKVPAPFEAAPASSRQPKPAPATITNHKLCSIENLGTASFLPDLNMPLGDDPRSEISLEAR